MINGHLNAVHMGTYKPSPELPGHYVDARGVNDSVFVPTGPITEKTSAGVARDCARYACYTDDSQAALALASSIVA